VRLARTATSVADGLYLVIPAEEFKLLTPASRFQTPQRQQEVVSESESGTLRAGDVACGSSGRDGVDER
jgi:hypothetical protein